MENKLTLTVEEAAQALGISRPTAFKLCNEQPPQLPIVRLGRRILVSRARLEAMINEGCQTAAPVEN